MIADPLGRILTQRHLLQASECNRFLQEADKESCFLEEILIREDVFSREELLKILENEYFCPSVDLRSTEPDYDLLNQIPRKLASRNLLFPLEMDDHEIAVAMADPDNEKAKEALALSVYRTVMPMIALRHDLRDQVETSYKHLENQVLAEEPPERAEPPGQGASRARGLVESPQWAFMEAMQHSPIELVNRVIEEAAACDAT
ncbi:MAG: hypothetical protein ACOC2L_01810, partial [Candidatus Sumerlaeota bacterium]